eukprot:29491-Pyramimonas_sp.AAC.1
MASFHALSAPFEGKREEVGRVAAAPSKGEFLGYFLPLGTGVLRRKLLRLNVYPCVVEAMNTLATDAKADAAIQKCGAVALMYLATEASAIGRAPDGR